MQVKDTNRNRKSIRLIALACAILQLALAPHIHIAHGVLNFCLVGASLLALTIGGKTTVLSGFVFGLIFDLSTTGPIGLMCFELTLASFILGAEMRNRIVEDRFASAEFFALIAFSVELIYGVAMLLVGQADSIIDVLIFRSLPSFVLDMVGFGIAAWFMRRSKSKKTPSFSTPSKHGGVRFDTKGL